MTVKVWRDGRVDDQPDEGLGRPEPASQEDVCRDEYASRVTEGRPWEKVIRPALRRGLAENAVARHGVSLALACRTFDVSETCYRYSPLLSDENEEIADLLVGLTAARKTWGDYRLMRDNGIKVITTQKYKATTDSNHTFNIAPNLLDQDFSVIGPNQKWAGDISYIWTSEGWLYLAVILDLYSQRVIGWAPLGHAAQTLPDRGQQPH